MTKASDNVFSRFLISEGGSTSTPSANRVTVYAKADGLLYQKDDAGTETLLAGGSGAVGTDVIWDTKGDLAVATGANTASKLAAGANGLVLTAASGEATGLKWAAAGAVGRTVWAPVTGWNINSSLTGGNLGINGGSLAFQVDVNAAMYLYSINYRNTDTATARAMEWGLYYDDGTTASPRVAYGTDSFTPGAASDRTSAVSTPSPPAILAPGSYWIVVRNTGGATNFQMGFIATSTSAVSASTRQAATLGSALGTTLDLSTGWTRSTGAVAAIILRGAGFGEVAAW